MLQRVASYWLLCSAVLAVLCVGASLALSPRRTAEVAGINVNLIVFSCALALSVVTGLCQPAWWRRILFTLMASPILILSYTSGNIFALETAGAILLPAIWFGREIIQRMIPSIDHAEAWVIGSGIGIGLLSAIGFTLGAVGHLRPILIWPIALGVVGTLAVRSTGRLRRDLHQLASWLTEPDRPRPLNMLCAGMLLSCTWLNLIGSLAPEMRSDAIRQRLATVVEFATNGNLSPIDPDLLVARDPAFGEIAYAVAVGAGPLQSAKIINWILGILCTLAIFVLGRRLCNAQAGGIAAVAFSTTLLVGYLSQTAYLDLFTVLFAVVAALCLSISASPIQRYRLIACAGMLLGCGVATKLHFGYIAIGVAIMAMGVTPRSSKSQLLITMLILTTAALIAAAPWLIRSAMLTGSIPGFSVGVGSLSDGQSQSKGDLVDFGFDRSLVQLLIAPFTTTFLSGKFGGTQILSGIVGGHTGFTAFGFVPLLFIARHNKRTTALLAGTIGAAVFWFYTAQYIRYALPIIAFLAVLTGISYATLRQRIHDRRWGAFLNVIMCVMLCSGMLVRLQLPDMAHRFAIGLQNQDDFLTNWMGGQAAGTYAVTKMLNAEPGATRVLASYDGARLYSRVRISQPWSTGSDLIFEGDAEQVWSRLQAGGYSHILLDRSVWQGDKWLWDRMTVIDEDFLRCNTALVGGGDSSYLYRLLPPDQRNCKQQWARGRELLANGGFEDADESGAIGWHYTGNPTYNDSGVQSRDGRGAITLMEGQALSTTVRITENTQYLLAEATRTATGYGRISIWIEWRDAKDKPLGTASEAMPVSPRKYHTFSMLASAPSGAVKATIHAEVTSGTVWFDDFSLKSVEPDTASMGLAHP